MEETKSISSKFLNDNKWINGKFEWQRGYGVFINKQLHHKKKSFRVEYIEFLKIFKIEYDEKYLFEWIED